MSATTPDVSQLPGLGIKPWLSLRRHRTAAWVAALLVLIAGIPITLVKGRSHYVAEAVFQVAPSYMKNMDADKELELQSNSQYREYVNHLSSTVVRYDVLESALQELRSRGIDTRPPALSERKYIERLQRTIYVRAVPDTYMVKIGTEDASPKHLHELVNSIAERFVATTRAEQIYGSGERLDVLRQRVSLLNDEIKALSAERVGLAERLGLTTYSESTVNPYDTTLAQSRERLAAATLERAQAEATLSAYREQREVPTQFGRSLLDMRLQDNGLQALRNEVVKRSEELRRQMAGLEPRHPTRVAAQTELQSINQRLLDEEQSFDRAAHDNVRSRLQAGLASRMQVEREARGAVDQLKDQAAAYARDFQQAMRLTAEIKKRDTDLVRLRERLNYLDTEANAIGWVRLVTRALPAETPQGIGRTRLALASLAAALLAALTVPVVLDALNQRIRTVNELEKLMGIPCAGWQVRTDGLPTEVLWTEQARRFASTLIRTRARAGRHVFAFTGVKSGGGVSTTTLDTAAVLADLGARPLVVQADPRADASTQLGLTDYLAGEATLDGLDQKLPWRGQDIPCISIGHHAEGGLRRLDRMQQALTTWSEHYDFVLLDLPPLLLNADAELLIECVGQVFLHVEADTVSRGEVLRARRVLERIAPEAVGVFLNKLSVFPQSGYMKELIVETATRSRFEDFMSASAWQLRWALAWAQLSRWRRNLLRPN